MEPLAALDASSAPVVELVSRIRADQWAAPTPCTDWDVQTLVGHIVATTVGYRDLLDGAPADRLLDEMSRQATAGGDEPLAALRAAAHDLSDAFATPGALERPVSHMIGDINGLDLLELRITENVIHGCDLATAIGAETSFEPDVVEIVHARLAPIAELLPIPGFFDAPANPLAADATRLEQVLHLVGR
jgi:uncharacterized protein (TIGR03086 family)